MEALVNAAYDRISEDLILLYDTFQAYEEANPRPPLSALLDAIRQVLKEEDKGRKAWSVWSSISREDLRSLGGARLGIAAGVSNSTGINYENSSYAQIQEEQTSSESGLREVVRVLLTSIISDLAVLPFWTVKLSAVTQRGRIPELWPFTGYRNAFIAIIRLEGWKGLFKGAVPICAGGLLRYLRRNRRLYSDYYWKTTQRLTARLVMKEPGAMQAHDPEMLVQTYEGITRRALWAAVLHPFDLLATRMITTAGPRYQTFQASIRTIVEEKGWKGILVGIRSSLITALLPYGTIYTFGIPFVVKTRRLLDGAEDIYRSGLGGSLELLRDILKQQGFFGLFAGMKASCWGFFPAFGALCGARLLVYMITGGSSHAANQRRKRKALLRSLLSSVSETKLPPQSSPPPPFPKRIISTNSDAIRSPSGQITPHFSWAPAHHHII